MLQLTIKEEVFGSGNTTELPLALSSERLTLAELIQQKVAAKVRLLNADLELPAVNHRFLTKAERILNRATLAKKEKEAKAERTAAMVDSEQATYEALAAFQNNGFFVIIDGQQRENLEEELLLTDQSQVQFIRLMPLVGG